MKPWIMPYHVDKLESGLLVASAEQTHVSPLKAAFGPYMQMKDLEEAIACKWATCNSTPLEDLQKIKEKHAGDLPATLYGIPVFYDESVSWPATCPIQPRTGLATEYPELRDEFEQALASTPAGRWAAEVDS